MLYCKSNVNELNPMQVIKLNKRLVIIDSNKSIVYSPPDFIILPDRKPLINLANKMNIKGRDIDLIIEFESSCKYKRSVKWK